MNWTEANGVSLRYELAGRGGEVVVLIHEMGGTLEKTSLTAHSTSVLTPQNITNRRTPIMI